MKTAIEQTTVTVIGGAKEARFIYRTDEYQGIPLGNGLRGDDQLVDVQVDNFEAASDLAIKCGNVWVPKSQIESIEYIGDTEAGPFEPKSIRVPAWVARKL